MGLSVWTNPDNTTPEPLPVARPEQGTLLIVPRHMTGETVELAMEWWEYTQVATANGAEDDGPTQTEALNRWENYVEAVSPTFTSRGDAMAFAARLLHAIEIAWPVA
jgi:hypothetical protein